MKKRCISAILAICLLFGAILPTSAFAYLDNDMQQVEHLGDIPMGAPGSKDMDMEEEENPSEPIGDISNFGSLEGNEGDGTDIPPADVIDIPIANIDVAENNEYVFFQITVDEYRHVSAFGTEGIGFAVLDENGEGDIIVMLKSDDPEIDISAADISVNVPMGWVYEIEDGNHTITITPPPPSPLEEITIAQPPEVNITADEERNVTVFGTEGIGFAVLDENGEGDIIVMLKSDDPEINISEADIAVNVPMGWVYKIDSGDEITITITPPPPPPLEEITIAQPPEVHIIADVERNVTVIASPEVGYEIGGEDGVSDIIVTLQSVNPEINISEANITVDLPLGWTYKTDIDQAQAQARGIVTVTIIPQMAAARMLSEDVAIRVENRQELLNVFTHGAVAPVDGSIIWSGTRTVEIAFTDFGGTIITGAGMDRTVILRSADNIKREITTTAGAGLTDGHFLVGSGVTLIIDDENLHFVGNNPDQRTAGPMGGGIWIYSGGTVELHNGTIRNVNGVWERNAVFVRGGGTFKMYGGFIQNNRSNGGGGVGTFEVNARFDMHGGIIQNNHATESGGGVRVGAYSNFNMYGGIIRNNIADGTTGDSGGGGVRVINGALFNMQDGLIEGNKVTSERRLPYGGGVHVGDGTNTTFNMNGGTIRNNTAPRGGGVAAWEAIFNLGTGRTTLGRATDNETGIVGSPLITENEAVGGGLESAGDVIGFGGGGGVFVYGTSGANFVNFIMHAGAITNNVSNLRGGGVFLNSAVLDMRGGEISNNRTIENDNPNSGGGGVYMHEYYAEALPAAIKMSGGAISGNISRNGGAIARKDNRLAINITGTSVISGNTASHIGGGIYTGNPAPETNATDGPNIALGRGNLFTAPTVIFQHNRSQLPISNGLTVFQVRTNNLSVYNNVQWSGNNSAKGVWGNDDDFHIFNNHDIGNLQGIPITGHGLPELTTLAVSKSIIGTFSNIYKEFEFAITFKDSKGDPLPEYTEFSYVGDTMAGSSAIAPAKGILTLDSGGSATFSLGDGQVIIIEDVPLDIYIQIAEAPYEGYTASFVDSEDGNPVFGNDTNLLAMTEDRVFSFANERYIAPPTGISADDAGKILVLAGSVSLPVLIISAACAVYRRRKGADDEEDNAEDSAKDSID
jgi:hypothetical protein